MRNADLRDKLNCRFTYAIRKSYLRSLQTRQNWTWRICRKESKFRILQCSALQTDTLPL